MTRADRIATTVAAAASAPDRPLVGRTTAVPSHVAPVQRARQPTLGPAHGRRLEHLRREHRRAGRPADRDEGVARVGRRRRRRRRPRSDVVPARPGRRPRAGSRSRTIAGLDTPYVNTIPPEDEPELPGDPELERLATALVRWNAVAIVLQANAESTELGGHIASYQSAETLYEIGFNHFWRARSDDHLGDLVYIQGHSSPGIYARAFLEGRLGEDELRRFRQEVGGGGLSSYPHPWLMPDFWQFPTVSMGLGPLMAIYQARFMKYLAAREIVDAGDRKVWAFMGDGEMDEPESMGAISLAGREKLDNLVFVVNCNLQRLDGPVRGNGKIIQELETNFRGAGWNVIKVIWGSNWDPLLEADDEGVLRQLMEECVDGEYQTFKANDGAFVREHFFGRYPETKAMVADWTDEEIWALRRGGHDPAEGVRRLRRGRPPHGPADRDPREDDQGLRDGRRRRGPEHHPPAEGDERRGAARDPRPARAPAHRRAGDGRVLPPPAETTARSFATCSSAAPSSAAASRRGTRTPSRCRRRRPSRTSSRGAASARTRPRWRSSASSTSSCATRRSGRGSSRSCPTSHGRSGWRGCSGSSGSSPRSASSTSPRTPATSCSTARTSTARSSRRASTSRAPSRRGSRRRRRTRTTASRWCRSTSSTRCSASSGSATSPGLPATAVRAGS